MCCVHAYLCLYGNKRKSKFRSENNKRAETGFMVKARGKSKPSRNVMGLQSLQISSYASKEQKRERSRTIIHKKITQRNRKQT